MLDNMSNTRKRLNGLDLFSGIAGNTLGLRNYIKTVAYCEADRHAQSVLLSRMGDGSIEPAPIWDDIKTLGKQQIDCPIDIIVGGFPCQDVSVAGRGEGILEGNRSGLFFEIVRLAQEIQPTFLFLENVPAVRTRGLDTVIQELTKIGYDLRWTMLSAAAVGANHKRERWFLLAHASGERRQQESGSPYGDESQNEGRSKAQTDPLECYGQRCREGLMANPDSMWELSKQGKHERISDSGQRGNREKCLANSSESGLQKSGPSWQRKLRAQESQGMDDRPEFGSPRTDISDSDSQRCEEQRREISTESEFSGTQCSGQRSIKSDLGGMANGLSIELDQGQPRYLSPSHWQTEPPIPRVTKEKEQRVERVKRLGNAVVPLQAKTAFEILLGLL